MSDLSGEEEDDEEDEHLEDLDALEQLQAPGSGPYTTLQKLGSQISEGSAGHPLSCTPCTFYCFTRRGCNRGVECHFCHLVHKSKLQQRREAWKKQQREKRKSIRERVVNETRSWQQEAWLPQPVIRGDGGSMLAFPPEPGGQREGKGWQGAATFNGFSRGGGARGACAEGGNDDVALAFMSSVISNHVDRESYPVLDPTPGMASFTYDESRVTLAVGQEVELRPQVQVTVPVQFHLLVPLPQGLMLDQATGLISGMPTAASLHKGFFVEAVFSGGTRARAVIEIEVVDFTRGGFVVGHVSEVEPGKFMLLFYVPQETGGVDVDQRSSHMPHQGCGHHHS